MNHIKVKIEPQDSYTSNGRWNNDAEDSSEAKTEAKSIKNEDRDSSPCLESDLEEDWDDDMKSEADPEEHEHLDDDMESEADPQKDWDEDIDIMGEPNWCEDMDPGLDCDPNQFCYFHIMNQLCGYQIDFTRNLTRPDCNKCGTYSELRWTSSVNENGNRGRPYFRCPKCPVKQRWVTWADAVGVDRANPPCYCGPCCYSRLDRVGVWSGPDPLPYRRKKGDRFLCCATGECAFKVWL